MDESFGKDCEALLHDDDMINIYGRTYAAAPQQFQFQPGDVKLIKGLVEHVKNEVDGKGTNKGLHKFRGKKEKTSRGNCFNEMSKENVAPKIIQLKNVIGLNTAKTEQQHADLKCELYQKVNFYFESYEVEEADIMSLDLDMIKVFSVGDSIYGSIVCVICKNENAKNQKPKRVYYHESSESSYWVMSNFLKHLEKYHHLVSTQKYLSKKAKRKKVVHDNMLKPKNSFSGDHSIAKIDSAPILEPLTKSVESTIETFEEIQVDVFENENQDENEIVCDSSEPQQEVIQNELLYKQLSQQITKMIEAVLINSDVQESMKFNFKGEGRSVAVAKIDGNGDCLYAAICHQLFHSQVGGKSHIKETATLRANVVNYILEPENYPSFEFSLQDRVYETKTRDQIEDMTRECKLYTRLVLSRPGKWGGYETIKAVGEMHHVNILIFNEDDTCYISNKSNQIYDRTIAIAYRKADACTDNKVVYDHYDSICDLDTNLLYEIANSFTM